MINKNREKMFQNFLKILIISVLLVLISIFYFSWVRYQAKPVAILKYMLAQVGSSIGVSLTVPENPFNTWAKQLQEKETELQKREEAVNEILIKTERESRIIVILILVLMIILFFLLLINFYFDWRTRKFYQT